MADDEGVGTPLSAGPSMVNEFSIVLAAATPVFLLLGVGWILRLRNWLQPEADETLFKLNIHLLTPCLILDNIVGNTAFNHLGNVIVPPLVGFATIGLGLLAGLLARKWTGLSDTRALRTFAFTVGLYNYGFIPYPLTTALFDRETLGVMFVHNVGVEAAIWTVGVMVVSAMDLRRGWKHLLNGPVVAIVLALTLNRLGVNLGEKNVLRVSAHMLGLCAIPVGLLQIGATIEEHASEFGLRRPPGDVVWGSILRLGLLPMVFLLVARWLPISVELKRVMVIQAAMPCAVFPIVMTAKYGGDPVVALRVVMVTSVLGFATMPLWIRFGMRFVGLNGGG